MLPDNVFWTSDLHFDHRMMVEKFRAHMGWTSKEEMSDYLIDQWNSVVPKKGATVFVIGDIFFCNPARAITILDALHGSKCLIRGNHDKTVDRVEIRKRLVWIKDYARVKINDPGSTYRDQQGEKIWIPGTQPIVMSHYPMVTWHGSGRGSWMLHGHCHGNLQEEFVGSDGIQYRLPPAKRLDVGVDVHNFKPLTYAQIKAIMATKGFQPVDQHGQADM